MIFRTLRVALFLTVVNRFTQLWRVYGSILIIPRLNTYISI
nr:MAG TPA: hypothetical protein [Caudoviricetes sp.]